MKKPNFLLSAIAAASVSSASAATVAYWDFDNGNLSSLVNNTTYGLTKSGTNHTGSTTNLVSPVPNPDAVAGAANGGSLTSTGGGNGNLVGGSGSASSLLVNANSWTLEGWLNVNDDGFRPIVSTRGLATDGMLFDKRFVGGQNVFSMFLSSADGATTETVFQDVVITKNTDFHFALTHNGSGDFELFVDGESKAEHSTTLDLADIDSGSNSALWLLGRVGDNDGSFGGSADEFRISDTVLTSSQFLNVPEPSAAALIGLAGFGLLLRRRRN